MSVSFTRGPNTSLERTRGIRCQAGRRPRRTAQPLFAKSRLSELAGGVTVVPLHRDTVGSSPGTGDILRWCSSAGGCTTKQVAGPASRTIAGNLYCVGDGCPSITGPEGHIVLDGGYPTTAPMIIASISKLGFSIKDVRVLLNSEAHPDHAGGLGVLQQASGAELWASEASAYSSPPVATTPTRSCRSEPWSGSGSWGTRRCGSTTDSRTATQSASAARAHRARHRRPHARMHLMVVPGS